MIKLITIKPETETADIMFFDRCNFTALSNPHVVPLFGPNGSGKTTFINAIIKDSEPPKKSFFGDKVEKHSDIVTETDRASVVYSYRNSHDNFRNREARSYTEAFDPFYLNARFDAQSLSEGQSIVYSLYDLFVLIGTGKESIQVEGKDLVVLIDELDSGLSLDNLDMFMKKLRYIIARRKDVQVIFSFNNSRVLKYFPEVISMYDGKVHKLHDENDMIAEFNANAAVFNKRRKRKDGRPKVPR